MNGLDHGRARGPEAWPAWWSAAGFVIALGATLLVSTILSGAYLAVGGDDDLPPSLTLIATLAQDLLLVGTAVALASLVTSPRPAHFGLRPPLGSRTVAWTVGAAAGFYVISAIYAAVVQPEGEQDVVDALGAEQGTAYLIAAAAVVIFVAPLTEEVFFRGFFYRALRNRFSVFGAASIVAVVFGSIHYSGPETLPLIPLLALIGVVFCLLYERTGSLYPAIALHAVNNSLALGATVDTGDAIPVAAGFGAIALAGCVAASRWQARLRVGVSP